MKIYLIITLLTLTYFLFNDKEVFCKGRGGGSRGGGSRSGGSRSGGSRSGGSRSGGSRGSISRGSGFRSSGGNARPKYIVSSSRYSTWSVRVGVSSSTRYRVSPWGTQHQAILAGHIIMSSHQRSRFHTYEKSYYDDISVCYNEEPLYNRNITASPWFICPWDDLSERFCCGDETEERCCRYFERTGHRAGLIIGIIIIVLVITVIFYCYRRSHREEKSTGIIFENKEENATGPLIVYQANVSVIQPAPVYSNDPAYAMNPLIADNNMPYSNYPSGTQDNLPYPVNPSSTDTSLPYPSNAPYNPNPYPMDGQTQYGAYPPTTDTSLPYPVNPVMGPDTNSYNINENMPSNFANAPPMGNYPIQQPPSYEDALKIKS